MDAPLSDQKLKDIWHAACESDLLMIDGAGLARLVAEVQWFRQNAQPREAAPGPLVKVAEWINDGSPRGRFEIYPGMEKVWESQWCSTRWTGILCLVMGTMLGLLIGSLVFAGR